MIPHSDALIRRGETGHPDPRRSDFVCALDLAKLASVMGIVARVKRDSRRTIIGRSIEALPLRLPQPGQVVAPDGADTCSRLEEPGGVRWKDVNVGRLRTITSGKRSIWWLRAVVRSGLWPRNSDCAILYCGVGWSNVGPGESRRRRRGARQRRRCCRRRTTRRSSPVCSERTSGCAWSATF